MEPRLEPTATYWEEEKEIIQDEHFDDYLEPTMDQIDKALTAWENRYDK